jgi:hypothetical protein
MTPKQTTVTGKLSVFIERAKEVSAAARKCLDPRSEFFGMSLTETIRGIPPSKEPPKPLSDVISSVDYNAANVLDLEAEKRANLKRFLIEFPEPVYYERKLSSPARNYKMPESEELRTFLDEYSQSQIKKPCAAA